MTALKRFAIADLNGIEPTTCPCGRTRRAFVDDEAHIASIHLVDIKKDSEVHYHKRLAEIYLILEGEGFMELDGERLPVKPMTAILIKPFCRHRAVGNLKLVNMPVPAFDPHDEWFDVESRS